MDKIQYKIAVCGLGFVGLTTALGFASKGFVVHGYDMNLERVDTIKNGQIPFYEPELDTALTQHKGKTFFIAEKSTQATKDADVVFFCVGTPCGDDGKADLSYIYSAINEIVDEVKTDCIFVIKSTVPPGTCDGEILPYLRQKGFKGSLANNPEFLREGFCWDDFINADRIVCGITKNDTRAMDVLSALYKPFNAPVHFVSHNTGEFIKYLSNSMLATMISFSNEMSLIADAMGEIEVGRAFKILHEDKRLAGSGIASYLYPGCGYGGYCLPKDTVALSAKAKDRGVTPYILDSTIALNNQMPEYAANKIKSAAGSKDTKIGILGLSFKPESDDVRDSSAAKIIQILLRDGYTNIEAHDPIAKDMFASIYGFNIAYAKTKKSLIDTADVVAVITAWNEYKNIKKADSPVKWVDCRYIW